MLRRGASFDAERLFKRRALTAPYAYGKAPAARAGTPSGRRANSLNGARDLMVKPEWGTKRTCPKCSTRFYDLGNEDPVHCIECGTEWIPEPVLKSKQPMPFDPGESETKEKKDEDLEAEELAIDEDEEPSADDEVDLATDDDDLGVAKSDEDEES
jgi:uncharacterized protein (TIGR02300 family)